MLSDVFLLLAQAINLYTWILIARILLSWFPAIEWWKQPWKGLNAITEPVMAPFRAIIPPIGGFDLSPILLFLLLNFVRSILFQAAYSV